MLKGNFLTLPEAFLLWLLAKALPIRALPPRAGHLGLKISQIDQTKPVGPVWSGFFLFFLVNSA